MRAFVAVEVPSRDGDARGRSAPEHLTLRFLGEIDATTAGRLTAGLGPAVAGQAAFDFVLEGVGAFPSRERPRVVWRGVTDGASALQALAAVVRAAVVAAGVPDEPSSFVPHVTLFRVRSPREREAAARLLAGGVAAPPPVRVAVTDVAFVESRLTPAGAVHRVLGRFPLAGRPSP